MTRAVLYKYINCTVGKLRALALVTNYINNYSIIIITTKTTRIIIIYSDTIYLLILLLKIYLFQGIIYSSHKNPFFSFDWRFGVVVSPPNAKSRVVSPDIIALLSFHIIRLD